MDRREFIKSASAAVCATVLPVPVIAAQPGMRVMNWTVSISARPDKSSKFTTIAKMGADGMWRFVETDKIVPGNDIDTWLETARNDIDATSDVAFAA